MASVHSGSRMVALNTINGFCALYPRLYLPLLDDQGRKIVFYPDRENRTNLFGVDLGSGDVTQPTDLDLTLGEPGGLSKNPVYVGGIANAAGTRGVYTADPQGCGQMFVVDVPAFESLPDRSRV